MNKEILDEIRKELPLWVLSVYRSEKEHNSIKLHVNGQPGGMHDSKKSAPSSRFPTVYIILHFDHSSEGNIDFEFDQIKTFSEGKQIIGIEGDKEALIVTFEGGVQERIEEVTNIIFVTK
jgi:hypothetical protein